MQVVLTVCAWSLLALSPIGLTALVMWWVREDRAMRRLQREETERLQRMLREPIELSDGTLSPESFGQWMRRLDPIARETRDWLNRRNP